MTRAHAFGSTLQETWTRLSAVLTSPKAFAYAFSTFCASVDTPQFATKPEVALFACRAGSTIPESCRLCLLAFAVPANWMTSTVTRTGVFETSRTLLRTIIESVAGST